MQETVTPENTPVPQEIDELNDRIRQIVQATPPAAVAASACSPPPPPPQPPPPEAAAAQATAPVVADSKLAPAYPPSAPPRTQPRHGADMEDGELPGR